MFELMSVFRDIVADDEVWIPREEDGVSPLIVALCIIVAAVVVVTILLARRAAKKKKMM